MIKAGITFIGQLISALCGHMGIVYTALSAVPAGPVRAIGLAGGAIAIIVDPLVTLKAA
jgi:hypothetical protein